MNKGVTMAMSRPFATFSLAKLMSKSSVMVRCMAFALDLVALNSKRLSGTSKKYGLHFVVILEIERLDVFCRLIVISLKSIGLSRGFDQASVVRQIRDESAKSYPHCDAG
jgi:hypothetical protein